MKRILIVRPDGIGDFVIFSAVLEAYAKLYPDNAIDLLCHPRVKDLAVAVPFIHKVYYFNAYKLSRKKYFPYLVYLLTSLNLNRYEKIIYPVYSRIKEVDELIKMVNSKEKIAFDGDEANDVSNERSLRNKYYTSILESDKVQKPEMDRNAEFVRKLGLNLPGELRSKFWFLPQDEPDAQQLIQKEGLMDKKYIVLFPGAGAEIRYWNSQNWIELIGQLLKFYPDYKIVLLGSGSDLKPIEEVVSGLATQEKIINLYGKTSLRLLAKIIEHSAFLISMETGAIHIAAATNTPNVCIIGGGHFNRFYPYGDLARNRIAYHQMDCFGCNWHCIYETIKCIKHIKVEDVFREVQILMNAA